MKKVFMVIIVLLVIVLVIIGGWALINGKLGLSKSGLSEYTSTKGDIVKVSSPRTNQKITSPLEISGEVKGNWSFEANLPATLTDSEGNIIVEGYATLQGDWMTTDYVPFKGILTFTKPAAFEKGYLILEKDNPSDQRELDDSVKIPVRF